MWTYPQAYNATDPISLDFFVPQMWYVMGRMVHASRMKQLVLYSVPDMLKPSYNFGGLSLIQMMLPYVTNWESVRDDIRASSCHSALMCGRRTWKRICRTAASLISDWTRWCTGKTITAFWPLIRRLKT
jgi:hypothetical protein